MSYDGTVNANEIQNLTYTFDNVGNIETITDLVNDVTHSFLYDGINRLTDAVATSSDPSRTYEQTFTYDLAGNIEKKTGIGGYTVMEWEDSQTHIKPKVVNFDDEVAGIANRTVEYNQDNKPTEITYAGGSITHLYYDGEGNRIKKVQGSNAVTYVGDIYEVREGHALSYIYANGKKIATITDSHEYYTHSDHLGSTSIVTDENGDAVEEIGYLPFGAVLFRNVYNGGTWESAYKFTGQEHDSEFELYNYNARLYDPVMGRFITPDTIVPNPNDPQRLNRYVYCRNNPLIYIDPSGHIEIIQQIYKNLEVGSRSKSDINALVVHQTGSSSSASVFSNYKSGNIGAHFLIDKAGKIYQTANITQITYHVGSFIKSKAYETKTYASEDDKSKIESIYLKQGESWIIRAKNLSDYEKTKNYPDRYPTNKDSIGIEIVGKPDANGTYEAINTEQQKSLTELIQYLRDDSEIDIQEDDVYKHPDISYKNPTEAESAVWYDVEW